MPTLIDQLAEANPDAITFDDLDEALVGIGRQWGSPPLAIYSADRIIEALVNAGASYEDAMDHYGHNIECLYAGPHTPIILDFAPEP
jgi:hypothetical protein